MTTADDVLPSLFEATGYRVLEPLGSGATSDVLVAQYARVPEGRGEVVALKRLLVEMGDDLERVAEFHREVRACGALRHPSVVRLVDAVILDDHPLLFLEYVRGLSLEALLERLGAGARLPDGALLYVMARLFEALAAAHALDPPIVHGPIRLSNVLFTWDGDVKLADFGITKSLTRAADVARGAAYVSPEEHRGAAPTPRSDVYAALLLVWDLLVGTAGVQKLGRTPTQLAAAALTPHDRALEELRPDLPRGIRELIARGLAHDPDERTSTAREIADFLAELPLERGREKLVSILSAFAPVTTDVEAALAPAVEEPVEPLLETPDHTPVVLQGPAAFGALGVPAGMPARRVPRRPGRDAVRAREIADAAVDASAEGANADRAASTSGTTAPALATSGAAAARASRPPRGSPGARAAAVLSVAAAIGVGIVAAAALGARRTPGPASATPAAPSTVEPTRATAPAAAALPAPSPRSAPSAPASGSASAAAPMPTPTPTPTATATATTGVVRTSHAAFQHRVFLDGKVIGEGEGEFTVPCGDHTVRVGSAGQEEPVTVPCGGDVSLP